MNIVELEEKLKTKGIKNITRRSISGIWGMNEQSYSRKRKEGSDIKEKNIRQLEQKFNISLLDDSAKAKGVRLDFYPDVTQHTYSRKGCINNYGATNTTASWNTDYLTKPV